MTKEKEEETQIVIKDIAITSKKNFKTCVNQIRTLLKDPIIKSYLNLNNNKYSPDYV